jgi:hypothetical protein
MALGCEWFWTSKFGSIKEAFGTSLTTVDDPKIACRFKYKGY